MKESFKYTLIQFNKEPQYKSQTLNCKVEERKVARKANERVGKRKGDRLFWMYVTPALIPQIFLPFVVLYLCLQPVKTYTQIQIHINFGKPKIRSIKARDINREREKKNGSAKKATCKCK